MERTRCNRISKPPVADQGCEDESCRTNGNVLSSTIVTKQETLTRSFVFSEVAEIT